MHGRARTDFIVLSLTRFDRGQLTREKLIANFTLPCLPRTKQEMRYSRIFHDFRCVHDTFKRRFGFHGGMKFLRLGLNRYVIRMENFHDAIVSFRFHVEWNF